MSALNISTKSNSSLLLVSTIITFLLLEICARIWLNQIASEDDYRRYVLYTNIPEKDRQWTPHHYLNYYPSPGYVHGLTHHNSLGYRDREFTIKKPRGTLRIIAIGGSTTYTIKVRDNNKTFTSLLEQILKKRYGYDHVEVINAGVGGFSSWESLINLQYRVLNLEPDLVIIYHGVNDVHTRLVPHSAYKSDNSGRRRQWGSPRIALWEHSTLLRIISRKLHLTRQVSLGTFVDADTYSGAGNRLDYQVSEEDQMSMLKKNPPIFFRRNLINMIDTSRRHGSRVLLATFAHSTEIDDDGAKSVYEQAYEENNSVVRNVANDLSCPLFDFVKHMSADRKYWADSVHVNEDGAMLKAKLFAQHIHNNGLLPKNNKLTDRL